MGTPTTLAERVRFALRFRGMRAVQLDRGVARELGQVYHPGWTHDVLTGQTRSPGAPKLMAAAKVLRVAPTWLMTGEGPMDAEETPLRETYSAVPGWTEAAADPLVLQVYPQSWIVEAVGGSPVMVRPERMTPQIVLQACALWLASAPEEERRAAARAEAARRREHEEKQGKTKA